MALRPLRKADLSRTADPRLAALAASGDESAFEAIFERHHRGLLSLCRHLLGSLEEAEDAVQHTFAAAYSQLVEREPPKHLRAWLYATARNRCLDVLRSSRDLPAELPPASTAGLSEEVERRGDLQELVADIGRLPEAQRAALVMAGIEELGHAEVAQVLGCPRDKVRALVYQARSSLSGWREARALPCREVRQELTIARGAALRRGHLRRHLKLCPACAAFRKDVDRQRRRVALVLPVMPALGFKERVLEAAWGATGAGAGSVGGASAGGGLGSLVPAPIKIGAAVLVLGGGVATFGGSISGGGPPERMTTGAPGPRSATVSGRHEPAARRDPRPQSASARSRVRERIGAASSKASAPDQAEPGVAAALRASDAATPSAQAAPQSPPTDAPAPDPGALPDVQVGADVGVQVGGGVAPEVGVEAEAEAEADAEAGGGVRVGADVEVDPPAPLP